MLELDLNICKICAHEAYADIKRRDGTLLYDHAKRISNQFARMGSYDMAAVALLHDVLTCTKVTKSDLMDMCIMKPVLTVLVDYVRKEDEDVIEYYERLAKDAILRHIKTADIVEDLLCEPTEAEYREWQYGLMIMHHMPLKYFKGNEKVIQYLKGEC